MHWNFSWYILGIQGSPGKHNDNTGQTDTLLKDWEPQKTIPHPMAHNYTANIWEYFPTHGAMHTHDMSSCPAGVPLIAVNPFQNVAELYDSKMVNRYKSDSVVEIKVWAPVLT